MGGGGKGTYSQKKQDYVKHMNGILDAYKTCVVVAVDNVKSQQCHDARKALRKIGGATPPVMLMGKNTLMRKVLKDRVKENPSKENKNLQTSFLPLLKHNVGLVFLNGDPTAVITALRANRVQAPARIGGTAPFDVFLPEGPTGLEPTKTQIFQQLGIQTKIEKQSVAIVKAHHLIKAGTKVGASEAGLLGLLGINPFHYGLEIVQVYDDGIVFGKEILDVTTEDFIAKLSPGINNVRALAIGAGYPTSFTITNSFQSSIRDLLALAIGTKDYTPSRVGALVGDIRSGKAAAAAAAPAPAAAPKKEDAKPAAKAPAPAEEEDEEGGFGDLFA